jgi:hypothetical protein
MKKNLLNFFIIIFLFVSFSCNNTQNKISEKENTENVNVTQLSISDFMTLAGKYVDKEISIQGIVGHVCKHSGKRMFIVGENPKQRAKINTGKDITSFDISLEGKKVKVQGIVKEKIVDENYLSKWEEEILKGNSNNLEIHEGKEGHENSSVDAEKKENLGKIKTFREQLKEKNLDHLSFYSVECNTLEVIE